MKKLISLLLSLALCLSVLAGCDTASKTPASGSSGEPDSSDVSAPDASAEESEPEPDVTDAEPEESVAEGPIDEPAPSIVVDAADAFDGAYSFKATESGSYTFACVNAADYEDESWTIVVLEEEFDDAIRYLPQAMSGDSAPEGSMLTICAGSDLSVSVEEGNYVYCISSLNAWTISEPVENASCLNITIAAE